MRGIDLLDKVIGKYAMRYRTNKWTVSAKYQFVDLVSAPAWLEYRKEADAQTLPGSTYWIIKIAIRDCKKSNGPNFWRLSLITRDKGYRKRQLRRCPKK